MGANHPGEIGFLCHIADPDYGIVTNVGKAHLEGFGNLEGVIRTKSELYRYLQQKEKGVVFVNGDNPLLVKATQNISQKIIYGKNKDFHTRGYRVPSVPYLKVRIGEGTGSYYISTRLTGDYNLENVLCAVTVGTYFGVEPLQIKKRIEAYIPSNNRSQLIESGSNTIIMDAYNANPVSMQASIQSFLQLPGKNKTFILGDMLELGTESQAEHQAITDLLSASGADRVFLVGGFFGNTRRPVHFLTFTDTEELSRYLLKNPVQNQMILIKGSHGIRLEKLMKVFN
jgi:UDP-N-acetylmuramoyl-tripeptide--D-alanyl-D-alanine ligase